MNVKVAPLLKTHATSTTMRLSYLQFLLLVLALCQPWTTKNCALVAAEETAGASSAEEACEKDESGVCLVASTTAEVTDDSPAEPAKTNAETQEESIDESKMDGEAEKVAEDPGCPSRPHIIRCAAANLDTNKNNKLERTELQSAIDQLPWLARGVLKIIGSVDKIMAKCDADGDDAISIDYDMETTKDRCLATCFKRKAFKKAFFPDCDL